ncbi:hypothetical protein LMG18101_05071 [Ralstonia flaminis]|uniref:Uncharacterized protein n=1 Tax=Ralstonia flaminis TaxID=3058597 RepID=A0ABN9JX04_9RALS|nr:hypothetical protein LMG18101_05071 [Ralstonia sp. LMG 18101]
MGIVRGVCNDSGGYLSVPGSERDTICVADALNDVAVGVIAQFRHATGAIDAIAEIAIGVVNTRRHHVAKRSGSNARNHICKRRCAGHARKRNRGGIGRLPDNMTGGIVDRLADCAVGIDRQDQAIVGVVDETRDMAVGIRACHHIAVAVIGIGLGEVEPGRVSLLTNTPPCLVVGVCGHHTCWRCRGQHAASSIVGVRSLQVQATVIHRLGQNLALLVILVAGDRATRVLDGQTVAQRIIGIDRGLVHPRRVQPLGQYTACGIVRVVGRVAGGVQGLGELPGPIVRVLRLRNVGVRLDQGTVGVVLVDGLVATRIRNLERLPIAVALRGRDDTAGQRHRDGTVLVRVGVGDDVAQRVRAGQCAIERIIGRLGCAAERVLRGNHAPEAIVGHLAHVAVAIHRADRPAECIVDSARSQAQAGWVQHRLRGLATMVVAGLLHHRAAINLRRSARDLFAKSVVGERRLVAVGVHRARDEPPSRVGIGDLAVLCRVADGVDGAGQRSIDDTAGVGPRQPRQGDARGIANRCRQLPLHVVLLLRHFTQRVDGMRQAAVDIVEVEGAEAIGVRAAGPAARSIVGVRRGVLCPNGVDLGLGLPRRQLGGAFCGKLRDDATLDVVADVELAQVRGAHSGGRRRTVSHHVVCV